MAFVMFRLTLKLVFPRLNSDGVPISNIFFPFFLNITVMERLSRISTVFSPFFTRKSALSPLFIRFKRETREFERFVEFHIEAKISYFWEGICFYQITENFKNLI